MMRFFECKGQGCRYEWGLIHKIASWWQENWEAYNGIKEQRCNCKNCRCRSFGIGRTFFFLLHKKKIFTAFSAAIFSLFLHPRKLLSETYLIATLTPTERPTLSSGEGVKKNRRIAHPICLVAKVLLLLYSFFSLSFPPYPSFSFPNPFSSPCIGRKKSRYKGWKRNKIDLRPKRKNALEVFFSNVLVKGREKLYHGTP